MTLREYMQRAGLTQREAAEAFGTSRPHLAHIIKGRKRPSLDLALRIERATGGAVPVAAWACHGAEDAPSAAGGPANEVEGPAA